MKVNVLLMMLAFALLMVWHYERVIKEQKERINALIELNHDKSVYIDAGCQGRYQGAEELLPGEQSTQ